MEEKKNSQNVEEKEEIKEEVETIEDRLNKKRMVILGAITAGISLFVIFSFFSNVIFGLADNTSVPQYQPKKEGEKTIAPKVEEDWKAITEMKINQLQERLQRMEDTNKQILQLLQEQKQEREMLREEIEREIEERVKTTPSASVPPPPPQTPVQYGQPQGQQGQQGQQQKAPALKEFKPDKEEETDKKEVSKTEKKEKKAVKIKLPLGFLKGLTLTGLDAPTFQYGQNNPHPVLIVSLSKQIIANNKKLNLKECFFLGSGFGEISSERAYIRLVKLSCIDKKGNVLEQKVAGWVLDDDGKVGLRGRVVSKQGAVLAKTFMAGLLEGLSRTIAATSTTIQISPVGTTQTLNPQDATKVALASGFQSAASRLAQFYMKIAEQMYPVVEVSPGRKITILISGGSLEKTKDNKLISNPLK
ncbi:TraB pilus assembly family protein (plasmid) [Persephonella marina EX-H1]|uniref:TraB pilus assembly family protein n=1 Tax=Persephonella marina (strain DSM 14350 / EX-H1) TaxID=123214 RepID=C0QUX1_PERMH|nr:TraB/VirB10 family protein [Persephonella marina]ACO04960.1 TraB pilus assembly family protein [Persephonella marina EX-H1]